MVARVLVWLTLVLAGVASAQTERWSLELDAPANSPVLYPDASQPDGVVVTAGNKLIRVNGDGEVASQFEIDGTFQTPPTVADLGGNGRPKIVAADSAGKVYVFDADGETVWTRDFNTPTGAFKHIVAADVHPERGLELLFGFDDGWLNCVGSDGKLLWRFFGDKFRVGGIAVGDTTGDGVTDIVYGTDNGNIYCLNGWGHVQWRYHEEAPYGRSGPVLSDLDGDGNAEVTITRSNQGNATCQIALDGKTGAFKWRVPAYMQGYQSNAIADLDGDGIDEVISADKGNHLLAVRADGSTLWEVTLEGRGIFWAPAIGDVDGDGMLDIITGARFLNKELPSSLYRVSADGRVLDRLLPGAGANTSPAMGDINGDGNLEVIVTVSDSRRDEGPNELIAYSWGGGGTIAWPSGRGDSAMRATRIAIGEASRSRNRPDMDDPPIERRSTWYWGEQVFRPKWTNGDAPDDAAFFVTSGPREFGTVEHRVVPVEHGNEASMTFPVYLAGHDEARVTFSLHRYDGSVIARRTEYNGLTLPDATWWERIQPAAQLRERAEEIGADTSRLDYYDREMKALAERVAASARSPKAVDETARLVDELRALGEEYGIFRIVCAQPWRAGDSGPFAFWQDVNPWDDVYGQGSWPEQELNVNAFRDEFESFAFNLANLTNESMDVRVTFTEPQLDQRPERTPELAERFTLRRAIAIPKRRGGYVTDALPLLDQSGIITLPPGETRQVWITADTHGLDDGEYEIDLYAGSLTHPPTIRRVRIRLNVWQVQLPKGVYAQMNWARLDPSVTSDQSLQDMLDHGVSVAYGPALPALPVDENGQPAGDPDWTAFDAALARLPDYFQLMFHGALPPQWPAGMTPEALDAATDTATASGIAALAKHMNEIGWGYDRWAFYFIDEPFLTGRSVIPELREKCEFVRAVDPNIRLYANPTGKFEVEYLDEFKDLIDVWQPEINFLKRDAEILAWFHENAETLWAYEATDPGKELLPLGYYRGLGWLAAKLNLSGVGYWVYKHHDIWWPLEVGNWAVVYPSGDEVVPSRRWEATRDGQEDFLAIHLLRQEIEKARNGHRFEDADKAEALLDEAIETVVGWQVGHIDEITRQTRDYEISFTKLSEYREKIAETIIELRASGAHNPIHFLGDD